MSTWWTKDFQSSPKIRKVTLWFFGILILADGFFNIFLLSAGLIRGWFSDQARLAGVPWLVVAQPLMLAAIVLIEVTSATVWIRKKSDLAFLAGAISLSGTPGAISPSHPLTSDHSFIFWAQFATSLVVIAISCVTLVFYWRSS